MSGRLIVTLARTTGNSSDRFPLKREAEIAEMTAVRVGTYELENSPNGLGCLGS